MAHDFDPGYPERFWRQAIEDKDGTKPIDVSATEARRAGVAGRVPKRQRPWLSSS